MQDQIKEFAEQMKKSAMEFYEKSGAKCVDINVRISPYEMTHKIGLEFYGCETPNSGSDRIPACGPGNNCGK